MRNFASFACSRFLCFAYPHLHDRFIYFGFSTARRHTGDRATVHLGRSLTFGEGIPDSAADVHQRWKNHTLALSIGRAALERRNVSQGLQCRLFLSR
jgi:hypothetical protein